jgi:WD40 repeat protein
MSNNEGPWGPYDLGYVAHTMALQPAARDAASVLLAVGSFIPASPNFVELVTIRDGLPQFAQNPVRMPHYFPPSRVRWINQDSLVTSSDYIRIWNVKGELQKLLSHDSNPNNLCAPITSVDSHEGQSRYLASCDVYGILSLWDTAEGKIINKQDLGQSLCDVAFSSSGMLAIAGDKGDIFLRDPRVSNDVHVVSLRERISGPARLSWSGYDQLAVSWQGDEGGLAVYNRVGQTWTGTLLRSSRLGSSFADLDWCPNSDFQNYLCSAHEGRGVEVWKVSDDVARGTEPCFQAAHSAICTSLSLCEVQGKQFAMLATMPAQQAASANAGSLWVAALPDFAAQPSTPLLA